MATSKKIVSAKTVTATKSAVKKAPAKAATISAKATPTSVKTTAVASREAVWNLRLKKVAKTFEEKGFAVSIVDTLDDATTLLMKKLLPASKPKSISFGGSATLTQASTIVTLKADHAYTVLDTSDFSIGMEAMIELRRQSLLVDFYISSVNAITEEGQLILLDGTGNRCAALQFGPKKVVLFIGRNKVCADFDSAVERIKNHAAPANAIRLNKKTPCTKTGYCMDCSSPDRICTTWTITERCNPKERIHIVLINEECGY